MAAIRQGKQAFLVETSNAETGRARGRLLRAVGPPFHRQGMNTPSGSRNSRRWEFQAPEEGGGTSVHPPSTTCPSGPNWRRDAESFAVIMAR